LLDAGAGAGALTEAVLERITQPPLATMVERDALLARHLHEFLYEHRQKVDVASKIVHGDFINFALDARQRGEDFTHIILNPPYAKIYREPASRTALRGAGIEASNLAAAFLWLSMDLLAPGGRLVAVVPRSFLSGPNYRAVRAHLAEAGALFRLHHFRDRRAVFGRDSVQQEVVVVGYAQGAADERIDFSASDGLDDIDQPVESLPAQRFRNTADPGSVIRIPTNARLADSVTTPTLRFDVDVSVGPAVAFRLADRLLAVEEPDAVPLHGTSATDNDSNPGVWLRLNETTKNLVYRRGHYVIVRRIAPPERVPRVVSRVIDATGAVYRHGVAFENHVLVLHRDHAGLEEAQAQELQRILESDWASIEISETVGGTQINVADVRALLARAAAATRPNDGSNDDR